MPYYAGLKPKPKTKRMGTEDRRRTVAGIQRLREQKKNEIPTRTLKDTLLLGDFNILSREDETFEPLDRHGWTVPLDMDFETNVAKSKAYDQIAFKIRQGKLKRGPSDPNVGTFDFFKSVFLEDQWETYYRAAKATGRPMASWDKTLNWPEKDRVLTRAEYFQQWRTWQMSDHMPLWIELKIDFTDEYLKRLAQIA